MGGTHCAFLSSTCAVGTKCAILRALRVLADTQIVVYWIVSEGYICFSYIAKNDGRSKIIEETKRKIILFAVEKAVFYYMWPAYEIVKNMLKT